MDLALFFSLVLLFVLTFVGNGLIPMPVTAYVLWLGQFHSPFYVVLVATLGTVLGCVAMEPLFRRFFANRPLLQKAIPASYHHLFLRQPGFFLFFFNALPFPWDPTRILALIHAYQPWRLATVLAVGRMVRYTLLVFLGAFLAQYQGLFVLVLLLLLLLPMAVLFQKRLRERSKGVT